MQKRLGPQPEAPQAQSCGRLYSPKLSILLLFTSSNTRHIMGDPFSAIAGAVSAVDVAVRSCSTIYDSARYLKDAPVLTQELQGTVQSIRSILQNVNTLVARYHQSQVLTAQLHLPDAVNEEIVAITTDLDDLSSLLPAPHSTRKIRAGVKWIKDRRKVEKLVMKLQQHQTSLILALQSPSQ